MGDNSPHPLGLSPITVAVVGIIVASTGLLIYHFIVVLWFNRRGLIGVSHREMRPQDSTTSTFHELPSSVEYSAASLIPACKYTSDIGLISKSEDLTCSVCLSEFKNGEEVKVLPECLHTFHVPCIDMWLYSHSNCPLCRSDAGVSTPPFPHLGSDTMRLPDSREP